MELRVPITLAAVFMQNLRSALQKHLTGRSSTSGATFCRFVYAVPLALACVALLGPGYGLDWPTPNPRFVLFTMLGGIARIAATALLVYLFSLRNFAVGTTCSKTETVQAAAFGLLILGEPVSLAAAPAGPRGSSAASAAPGARVRWIIVVCGLGVSPGRRSRGSVSPRSRARTCPLRARCAVRDGRRPRR